MSNTTGAETERDAMLHQRPCISGGKYKQYRTAITASIAALCAGSELAWTVPALPQILIFEFENATQHEHKTGAPGFRISEKEGAIVGSMLTIGALLMALPFGILADKIGRKLTVLILSFAFILNWVLIVFAANLEMVVAGRFFGGIGLGGACAVIPMYIGEIAEPSTRGILASFFNIFLCTGMLLSCVVGNFTNWVGLSLVLGTFPIILAVSFCFMPETPSFLVEKNKMEQAEIVLRMLRNKSDVSAELKEIQREKEEAKEHSASIIDIISNKGNIKALIAVCGVLSYQQLCGINAVVFYMDHIFKASGSTLSSAVAGIIITLVQLVVAYLALFFIEKANRKFYLMLSSTGMMLALAGLGMFFQLKNTGMNVSNIAWIPLTSCVLFMVMFSVGYGPIPWMLLGEIFSSEIKGFGSGLGVVINWAFAFAVTISFPLMNIGIGVHNTFYIFAGIIGSATIFVYFFVPETRGKTLTEIQEELNQ